MMKKFKFPEELPTMEELEEISIKNGKYFRRLTLIVFSFAIVCLSSINIYHLYKGIESIPDFLIVLSLDLFLIYNWIKIYNLKYK